MKAIAPGVFGTTLLHPSAAFAAPINATTISSVEVSNVDQVGLICNEYYGRCWRTRGPRYVLRYYYDPKLLAPAGATTLARPVTTIAPATADQGPSSRLVARTQRAALWCGPLLWTVASGPPAEGDSEDRPDRGRIPTDAEGQASISRVKATDREGDAVRTKTSFNCVAYHQPRSVQASKFELSQPPYRPNARSPGAAVPARPRQRGDPMKAACCST